MHAAEGFPRHYPSADVSSLVETAGVGFAVMSGCSHGITPVQGNFLPDKEFRYLRTVIVTAAVYRGLGSKLRPKANLSP
jgi:hypothetical protein